TQRQDFYVTLRACFVTRAEDLAVFTQSFNIFWRDPEFIETMMQALMPMLESQEAPKKPKSAERRAQEALMADLGRSQAPPRLREEVEIDSTFSYSDLEKLGSQDFEQMSASELRAAELALKSLHLPFAALPSRRRKPATSGRLDARAAFKKARRTGGAFFKLPKRKNRSKPPRLVLLVDISGSMSSYSRMMLLFAHTLMTTRSKLFSELHVFTFGTRLTNITRKLSAKDPDLAMQEIGQMVVDWDGGTAIGRNLDRFNKNWSRRVLGTDAIVVMISDGLERGDLGTLDTAAYRLQLSSRAFVWMNPLLRYKGFEPTAGGVSVLLPYADHFLSGHNLNSYSDLLGYLSGEN
ncbi:MAG: VWA domain-containing protein, partial [Pseudomonadota bacterium]